MAWSYVLNKLTKQIWQIKAIEFGDRQDVGGEGEEVSSDGSVVFIEQPTLEEKAGLGRGCEFTSRYTLSLGDQGIVDGKFK